MSWQQLFWMVGTEYLDEQGFVQMRVEHGQSGVVREVQEEGKVYPAAEWIQANGKSYRAGTSRNPAGHPVSLGVWLVPYSYGNGRPSLPDSRVGGGVVDLGGTTYRINPAIDGEHGFAIEQEIGGLWVPVERMNEARRIMGEALTRIAQLAL